VKRLSGGGSNRATGELKTMTDTERHLVEERRYNSFSAIKERWK